MRRDFRGLDVERFDSPAFGVDQQFRVASMSERFSPNIGEASALQHSAPWRRKAAIYAGSSVCARNPRNCLRKTDSRIMTESVTSRVKRPEKVRRQQREASARFYAKHPERVKKWARRWQTERNPEAFEAANIRKNGGTEPTRPRPDHCELCGSPPGPKRRINYDHCHESGEFRGWICTRCNFVLGFAKDDAALLRKMADYLVTAFLRRSL